MKSMHSIGLWGLLVAAQGVSADATIEREQQLGEGAVDLRVGLGTLSGRSQAKVYDAETGEKISQLFWDMKNVRTLHLGAGYQPLPWLSVNASGWTAIRPGNSRMTDYDWLYEDEDWSHRSIHPDTQLDKAYQAEVSGTLWALQDQDVGLGVTLGYQVNRFQWTARGGSYLYSSRTGFRDVTGDFPDGQKVISYRQGYRTPYIGVTSYYDWQDWRVDLYGKYSRWVTAQAFDTHHLRSMTFADKGRRAELKAVGLGVTYRFVPQFAVRAGVDYQTLGEAKGPTRMTSLETDEQVVLAGDAAGISNRTVQSNLSLSYQF